jgi:nitrous oxide reductase accessory protein NosL
LIAALFLAAPLMLGDEKKPASPAKKDKCPVCGMFVYKYPDFLAQIRFDDRQVFFFDGCKDMFKYYFNLKKYAPGRKAEEIAAVYVTDYYSLSPVDGRKAYYITGSDVYGPMGKELIPFLKESEAREFMKDHKGKSVFRFNDVSPAVLKELD